MLALKEKIYEIRGKQVMLISDLAKLYNMETKKLNQTIKRNKMEFNEENYFQLNDEESNIFLVTNCDQKIEKRGGKYKNPYVITLEGIEKLEIILKLEEVKNINIKIKNEFKNEIIESNEITDLIYEIRGKQVMLDYDLARLYEVETGNLNRARMRNIERFPENFSFQITKEEYINLKCQSGISKIDLRAINRNLPYVYTEEGATMLSTVLHTDIAIKMSTRIIEAFVQMRRFISYNMYNNNLEYMLINHDNRISLLEESFDKLNEKQKTNLIYFEGQIYDAYSVLVDILKEAEEEIIIIDNYLDKNILDVIKLFDKKTIIITNKYNNIDVEKYCKQYENLEIKVNNSFHDRYIIIDKKILYHSGASFKDIGKKSFSINKIEEKEYINMMLNKLV